MDYLYNNHKLKGRRQILRYNAPVPELVLWGRLKQKQLGGYKFRRQYSVGAYVIDFYCPSCRLAIEIDGNSHLSNKAKVYDRIRDSVLLKENVKILRFTNNEVMEHTDSVVNTILINLPPPTPPIPGGE